MEWTVSTMAHNHRQMVEELTSPETWVDDDYVRYWLITLVSQLNANGAALYQVRECRRVRTDDGEVLPPERFIEIDRFRGRAGGTWSYQRLTEADNPKWHDCPITFLELVPEPTNPAALAWRQKVREYPAAQALKRQEREDRMAKWNEDRLAKQAVQDKLALLKPGVRVRILNTPDVPYVVVFSVDPLLGDYNGERYKVPQHLIGEIEPAPVPVGAAINR